ncbi:3-oxoacyl-[acyl-carrier-protein] synthase 2 [Curvibacter sp. AEP1-3]|uniref:beta-ketoacyl-[acyl-carrier-protein] synthase family protein n=1 Tax=Curvibacter sp. AEP1-3 TaxID=1844971 RepID=UPI000B3C134A|nr:beta-ketoacyl-[acyl-carrier-protein] synthase family protein [Curvibacter sp. AEP1-3]ARV18646.1 3-oxoacyl-[acyl-carrier-protein] synthase 2 [Curvibacter sp. AEP1-3]
MTDKVVVTGLGALSSLGIDVDSMMYRLREGYSGLVPSSIFGYSTALGYVHPAFDTPEDVGDVSRDRGTLMALDVAKQAITQANQQGTLSLHGVARGELENQGLRLGVYWGVGLAGAHWIERNYLEYCPDPQDSRPSPWTVPAIMPNAPAAAIAMEYKARGACVTFANACTSSAMAIGEATLALQRGDLDVAIVGGSDASLVPGMLHAWARMRVLARNSPDSADHASRPFDTNRNGICLAEGAASLVLEREEHAWNRGARALARVVGYGHSCDAVDLTEPAALGQAFAMQKALRHAHIPAAAIGYVNAHATGTRKGDATEIMALHQVLGATFSDTPISSVKSALGHTVGAAGALEAVVSVRALQERWIPPTTFLRNIDPHFSDAYLLRGQGIKVPDLEYVMSNSFGFGGSNAALVFAQP